MTKYPFRLKDAIADVVDAAEVEAAEAAAAYLSRLAGRQITLEDLPAVLQALHPLIMVYIASRELRERGLMATLDDRIAEGRKRK